MTERSIIVRVQAITSDYKRSMAEAERATASFGTKASDGLTRSGNAATRMGESVKRGTDTLQRSLLAVSSVGAVAAFVTKTVRDFGELEDATAAAGVVFGDSMSTIKTAAAGAAEQFGISKRQMMDASVTFGTFGKSAGLAGQDLANFSVQMAQLAGDLASFRGGSPEQAIQAIGAALRGESEPIRQYGVLLDDATLRQRAFSMGLIETTKNALTPQQRVLAAQAEILAQTTDAQGDFARTSDSTANTAKRLAAESANLSAEIGQKLAPALVSAQRAGIGVIEWVSRNLAILAPLATAFAVVAAAVTGVVVAGKGLEALKTAVDIVARLGVAFSELSVKAKIATASAGAIGLALAAISIAYGHFAETQAQATQRVDDYTEALRSSTAAVQENVRAVAIQHLEQTKAFDIARQYGLALDVVTDAALGNADAQRAVAAAMKSAQDAAAARATGLQGGATEVVQAREDSKALAQILGVESGALADAQQKQQNRDAAMRTSSSSVQKLTSTEEDNTKALRDNIDALWKQANAILALSGSEIGYERAVDDATKTIRDNGRTLDVHTEKGRANREALNGIATASQAYISKLIETGASSEKVASATANARTAFIRAATAAGMGADQVKRLADKLKLVPPKTSALVEVTIKQPNVNAALANIQRRLYANPLYVPVRTSRTVARAYGGPLPGHAPHDRADNVMYAGTPGEWVIQRPTTRYYGDDIMAKFNAGYYSREKLQKLAYGGEIGRSSQPSPSALPVDPADLRLALDGLSVRITGADKMASYVEGRIELRAGRGEY